MITACPNAHEACPYYRLRSRGPLKKQQQHGCYADTNHLYYPKRDYKTPLEQEFRELPQHREQVCRWEHDIFHLENEAPKKPTPFEMMQALAQTALEEVKTT